MAWTGKQLRSPAGPLPPAQVVPDTAADAQLRDNPLVQLEGVRFYAGCPLLAKGSAQRYGCL